jgi:hypothetical protein
MKQIIPIDDNARIIVDPKNYILEYRRKSKNQISWRVAGYYTNLTSLCLDYLNSAPRRTDNAISSILELVQVIKNAESRICKIIINHKIDGEHQKQVG